MKLLPLVLAAGCAAGCGPYVQTTMVSSVVAASPRPLRARTTESVEVFLAGPPQRPYAGVALIEGERFTNAAQPGTAELLQAARAKAARIGCDGIVIRDLAPAGREAAHRTIHAVCVVFKDLTPDEVARIPNDEHQQVERAKHDTYQACLERQRELGKRAQDQSNPGERAKLLARVPVCST